MTKMFDVCSPRPRKNSEKPYWHRVGTAFEGEKGMNLVFDSLPLPDKDGRVSVFLFEQKEKRDRPLSAGGAAQNSTKIMASASARRPSDDIEDSIPF